MWRDMVRILLVKQALAFISVVVVGIVSRHSLGIEARLGNQPYMTIQMLTASWGKPKAALCLCLWTVQHKLLLCCAQ